MDLNQFLFFLNLTFFNYFPFNFRKDLPQKVDQTWGFEII